MVHEITSKDIPNILEQHSLAIVNFGADWCIDCRRSAPFYSKFSNEFSQVHFTHCNIDQDETLRPRFHIDHIPTMIFYREGQEIDRIVEVQTPSELKKFIENCLVA